MLDLDLVERDSPVEHDLPHARTEFTETISFFGIPHDMTKTEKNSKNFKKWLIFSSNMNLLMTFTCKHKSKNRKRVFCNPFPRMKLNRCKLFIIICGLYVLCDFSTIRNGLLFDWFSTIRHIRRISSLEVDFYDCSTDDMNYNNFSEIFLWLLEQDDTHKSPQFSQNADTISIHGSLLLHVSEFYPQRKSHDYSADTYQIPKLWMQCVCDFDSLVYWW